MKEEITMSRQTIGYIVGFVASLICTVAAYLIATRLALDLTADVLAFSLLALALIQLLVQLRFFLHVGSEPSPKWQSLSIIFTVLMLLVVVVGSLWIMLNLNYRMGMSGEKMNEYMIEQNKKGF